MVLSCVSRVLCLVLSGVFRALGHAFSSVFIFLGLVLCFQSLVLEEDLLLAQWGSGKPHDTEYIVRLALH